MEITIRYNDRKLTIQGQLQNAEPSVGLGESFEIWEIKYNDLEVSDDYDCEDMEEIEDICIKEVKEGNQSRWEAANV